jgi:hypothetical protein
LSRTVAGKFVGIDVSSATLEVSIDASQKSRRANDRRIFQNT